jgi:hypothetical protein
VPDVYDPLCPLEDAIDAFAELTTRKEMWVFENQYHPLFGLSNVGGLDIYDYVLDWLSALFSGKRVPSTQGRIAYIKESGEGPWSPCDWTPPVGGGKPYF